MDIVPRIFLVLLPKLFLKLLLKIFLELLPSLPLEFLSMMLLEFLLMMFLELLPRMALELLARTSLKLINLVNPAFLFGSLLGSIQVKYVSGAGRERPRHSRIGTSTRSTKPSPQPTASAKGWSPFRHRTDVALTAGGPFRSIWTAGSLERHTQSPWPLSPPRRRGSNRERLITCTPPVAVPAARSHPLPQSREETGEPRSDRNTSPPGAASRNLWPSALKTRTVPSPPPTATNPAVS
mmetsp:Transcript_1490/g.3224  ORF Transcript_1490/g.3224 Transcript_1490/m.3224 type:complete len:238 (-) Transcript_1490:737-1450(-)